MWRIEGSLPLDGLRRRVSRAFLKLLVGVVLVVSFSVAVSSSAPSCESVVSLILLFRFSVLAVEMRNLFLFFDYFGDADAAQGLSVKRICSSWRRGGLSTVPTLTKISTGRVGLGIERMRCAMSR